MKGQLLWISKEWDEAWRLEGVGEESAMGQ